MTAITDTGAPTAPVNRTMVLAAVMLATVLTALDTTIANVALPHMAGSVSASQDQIAWVLTSYIVASAICTPLTGWLSVRLGRKRLFLGSVIGFVVASALCGASQNLTEIVLARVLQGIFAAPLIPLSQAMILDIYSVRERGPAMSIWGVGVMVAPIIGPVLGGWLTDSWSWRWVFYINLPVGILCVLGIMTFVPETEVDRSRRFDIVGFGLLGLAIAALQLVFDRGQSQGWFDSLEIIVEASVAFVALWFSLVHSFTSARPFIPLPVFRDVNFATASAQGIIVGVVVLSVSALLPLMLQSVFGFSVLTSGLLAAPRGVGSIISLLVVGRLIGRADTRLLLVIGLAIFAASFYQLSQFTLDTSAGKIAMTGFFQGLGTGLVFLPLTTMAFATLAPETRADATSFFTLLRNLGGSAGISIMLAMLVNFSVGSRARLVEPYSLDNTNMQPSILPAPYNLTDPTGIDMLSSAVDHQAQMLAYSQVFHLMFLVTLAAMPFVFLMRSTKPLAGARPAPEDAVMH
jgi:DHA2 family multidrug resistance protein